MDTDQQAMHPAAARPHLSELTERLRVKDRRITGPRAAILSSLHKHPHPLTNREIFESLPTGMCDLAEQLAKWNLYAKMAGYRDTVA